MEICESFSLMFGNLHVPAELMAGGTLDATLMSENSAAVGYEDAENPNCDLLVVSRDTGSPFQELLFCSSPGVVLHLWLPGHAADLDEALHLLALEYLGTRFVRTPARHAGKLLQLLRRPQGSWLVVAKRGKVVGIVAATGNDAEEVTFRGAAPFPVGGPAHSEDESSDFGSEEQATWVCI
jgi:hypothetical protein